MKDINLLINAGFDVSSFMAEFGDQSLYNEILGDFYDESLKRKDLLLQTKNSGDLANYAIYVHAMKSESAYLGIKILSSMSYQHQINSESGNIGYINEHFDELMSELDNALNAIKIYLGK